MSGDSPDIGVFVANEQSFVVDEDRISEVARLAAAAEGASGEISILLVDKKRITDLNKRFLGEDGPTDVLSFPIDGLTPRRTGEDSEPIVIGEVVICPEVARAQASHGLERELDLLVAHGVLHLLGHDHDTEEGAARMREREGRITGQQGASAS